MALDVGWISAVRRVIHQAQRLNSRKTSWAPELLPSRRHPEQSERDIQPPQPGYFITLRNERLKDPW